MTDRLHDDDALEPERVRRRRPPEAADKALEQGGPPGSHDGAALGGFLAQADAGSRQRMVSGLQPGYGNRSVQRLVVQRDIGEEIGETITEQFSGASEETATGNQSSTSGETSSAGEETSGGGQSSGPGETSDGGGTSGGDSGAAAGGAGAGLVVNDDVDPAPNQLRKSDFLAQVKGAVIEGVDGANAITVAPYFFSYSGMDAADIEAKVKAEVPGAAGADSAAAMVPAIVAQVQAQVSGGGGGDTSGGGGGEADPWTLAGTIQAKLKEGAGGTAGSPASVRAQLGKGRPLDSAVRARMQPSIGADLSAVRIHDDTAAAGAAEQQGARAFTVGDHVAFGSGEYKPDDPVGEALLAHELAHVAQQRRGTAKPGQTTSSSQALEEEADKTALAAAASRWSGAGAFLSDRIQLARASLASGLTLQRCTNKQVDEAATDAKEIKEKIENADKVVQAARKLAKDGSSAARKLDEGHEKLEGASGTLGQLVDAKEKVSQFADFAAAITEANDAQQAAGGDSTKEQKLRMARAMDRLFVTAGTVMEGVPELSLVGKFLKETGTFFEDNVANFGLDSAHAQGTIDDTHFGPSE